MQPLKKIKFHQSHLASLHPQGNRVADPTCLRDTFHANVLETNATDLSSEMVNEGHFIAMHSIIIHMKFPVCLLLFDTRDQFHNKVYTTCSTKH